MVLFLDTEFTDFHQPALISLGLVSECGRYEFYAERTDYPAAACNVFVRENVLPKLGLTCPAAGGQFPRAELAVSLRSWLERLHALDSGSIVLVLYDFRTDYDLLIDALVGDVPAWIEGNDVSGYIGWIGAGVAEEGANAHHALLDARALRADWQATNKVGTFGDWRAD